MTVQLEMGRALGTNTHAVAKLEKSWELGGGGVRGGGIVQLLESRVPQKMSILVRVVGVVVGLPF